MVAASMESNVSRGCAAEYRSRGKKEWVQALARLALVCACPAYYNMLQ